MTDENKEILRRINDFSAQVLADVDAQNTQVSFQLEKLRPIMEEIAVEKGMSLEDVFILYMDLQSEATLKRELEFQKELQDIKDPNMGGNFHFDIN